MKTGGEDRGGEDRIGGDRITYPTAEHWMMVGKANVMGVRDRIKAILTDKRPALAKKQGHHVVPWDQKKWEKNDLMLQASAEIWAAP